MSNSRFGLRTRTGVIATILESFNNVEGLVFKVDSSDTNSYTGTGITWNDLSGYGNTGTLYNSPTFEPSNLKSFRFDGVNAYADFGNSTKLNTGNQITVFSIFQINSTKTYQPIIAKSIWLPETGGWELANNGGVLRSTLYPSNSNTNNLYAGELQIDRWYIAAFTYNGSIFKMYLDGQLITQMTITTAFPTIDSTSNLFLGRRNLGDYYKGNILYAATYAKAYSDSQVLDEYNNLKSKVSVVSQGLILNLDANNIASYSGSGNTWVDLSGSGNHATLTNNPTFDSTYKSFKFNGINQSFTITPGTNLYPRTNDFTWSAWLNFGEINYGSKYRTIWYGNASGGNSGFGITLEPQNNRFIVEVYGTTGSRQRASYNILTDIFDKWNHWTVILDRSNFQVLIYLNTNLVLTYQAVNWGDLQPSNNYVTFGKHEGDVWFYDGQVSEILIYNRKLEQYEIGKNYNLTKYRYDKIDDGLIMHLDAATTTSYNGGGTIWYDISGNNNHSTLLGHTYDKVDRGSIILDGITSQITTPIIAESPSTVNYTYEITFSLDSMDIGYYSLMGRLQYLISGFGLVLYKNNTTINFYYYAYGASSSATTTSFNINKVTHTVYTVTMTISGRTANFYLNGVYKTQVTGTHDIVKYSQPILIGNGVQGGWGSSNIRVYNVKIYNKVLKLSEIIRNWKSIKSRYGVQIVKTGLKLYLDGENTLSNTRGGSVWYDLSGYGNNASLINSPIQSNQNSGIVKFDGTNQYASVPHSDTLNLGTEDFTLLMWVGDMRSYPGQKTLLWKGSVFSADLSQALIEGKGVGFSITWASSPQQLYFVITTTSSISQIALTEYNASWSGYKLIGIKRSGNQIFSINDTVVTLKGTIGTMNVNNTNPLYIANSGYYSNNFLKSEIGMVTIYEKALTNDEILQNYNVMKNKYKDKTYVTNGLVLNLDAGKKESYGGTGSIWYDLTTNANNSTLYGSATFSNTKQGVIVFDGTTNSKASFYAPNLNTTTTIEIWAKIESGNFGKMMFGFDRYNVMFDATGIGFNTANSDLVGISTATLSSYYPTLIGSWHHFVFVMRSDVSYTNNLIFINGNQMTPTILSGTEAPGNRNFNSGNGSISTWSYNSGYFMNQSVGLFRVYNRALGLYEVVQNYNTTKQRYTPLTIY